VRREPPDGSRDREQESSFGLVAGVDEVGRGALAGPVTVAAVILNPLRPIRGLDDSKKLSAPRRERLAAEIVGSCLAWSVVQRSAAEIDRLNILEATREAMTQAVGALLTTPGVVISDAVSLPSLTVPWRAEIRADAAFLCVAAASILAKVIRDSEMRRLAIFYPEFGWESNVGYPTGGHLAALRRHGPTGLHRRSFAPVRVLA
jgi:ribonuclease HII